MRNYYSMDRNLTNFTVEKLNDLYNLKRNF